MDEQLSKLLREVILSANAKHIDSKAAAEHAARAYKAGLAAFREKVTLASQPADLPSKQ